jgi:hypothetical protein
VPRVEVLHCVISSLRKQVAGSLCNCGNSWQVQAFRQRKEGKGEVGGDPVGTVLICSGISYLFMVYAPF